MAEEVTDKIRKERKERKEFHIPKLNRERSLYGSEFEIHLRNKLKGRDQPMPEACRRFNAETADGRQMQAYADLLGQAIRSMIQVKEEKDMDSLFTSGRPTALVNAIARLDDFDLITFLVIQA